jgi:hypothetical protein
LLSISSTLKMKAVRSSETYVNCQTRRHHLSLLFASSLFLAWNIFEPKDGDSTILGNVKLPDYTAWHPRE